MTSFDLVNHVVSVNVMKRLESFVQNNCKIWSKLRYPEDVKHFPVIWQGDGYLFGKHKFDNLRKLLEHFENIPAIGETLTFIAGIFDGKEFLVFYQILNIATKKSKEAA